MQAYDSDIDDRGAVYIVAFPDDEHAPAGLYDREYRYIGTACRAQAEYLAKANVFHVANAQPSETVPPEWPEGARCTSWYLDAARTPEPRRAAANQ